MSLFAPYLFSGSVSLYVGYKMYNSYYNQPFQYLEIEEEKDNIENNNEEKNKENNLNKNTIDYSEDEEIIYGFENDKSNIIINYDNDEINNVDINIIEASESEEETEFGFPEDIEIKKFSNKIVDSIIEKARKEKIFEEDKAVNFNDNVNESLEGIKNELSISEEILRLENNNNEVENILIDVNKETSNVNVPVNKPKRRKRKRNKRK